MLKVRLFTLVAVVFLIILPILGTQIQKGAYGNQTPIASFTYSPEIPTPEQIVTFDASASYDPDGWITKYSWNFGDGNVTTVTNPTIAHAYPIDGNYTAELTVTDNSQAVGVACAVVEVSTEVYFRVCFYGTIIPMSNVEVTMYYNSGTAWVKAPVGSDKLELRYDNMTQPDLANTPEEKYRNSGFTASILRQNASNVGFDIHPSSWKVFFKFKWGETVTYWPNHTTKVYTYNNGIVEAHDYSSYNDADWDPTAGTYVIKAKDIPKNGVSPGQNHPIIVGTLCPPPKPKYYLAVRTAPTGITTIPGQGWYSAGTNVTLTAPQYVNASADTRYRFSYWDVDGTSRGAGVNPITVTMNANHTATAHYISQYLVTFTQTGLSSDSTGTVATVDGAPKAFGDLPFTKWVDSGGSVTYSCSSTVSSSVTGKRYRLGSVTGPSSPITVTGAVTVTGNYVTQYLVTFAQTGLDSTATGTVVTVNSGAKMYTDLPYSAWFDSGASVTYSYNSIVSSTITGKRFRLVAIHCPPSPFIVTGPVTITGEYCKQYQITFAHSGLDSTAMGTVVTVDGNAKLYTDLPYSVWVDSGSSVTYSYTPSVSSSVFSKRFRLTSVTGSASPITVTAPTTVTGNYMVQYLITFASSGLDSTATGTVVTVNGVPKTYADLPYSVWVDSGSSVTYSYSSTVSSSVAGKRFRLVAIHSPTSPFTVTGPVTITGEYYNQYQVNFAQSGLDSTATGTVVTVNGSAKTYADLPYALWVDSGGSVSYSYSSPVSSTTSGKRFRLSTVTGPASPITVSGSTTVTGNYVLQYSVTFSQSGLDSSATGTVVTVNTVLKDYADLPYTIWVDSGSSVTYSYNDVVLSSTSGKRFKMVSVTGPTSPITVTSSLAVAGNYKTQYQVTFDQSGVGTDFAGTVVTIDSSSYGVSGLPTAPFWWDQGSSHSFAFASPLVVNATKQYAWTSTSGLSSLQSGTLTISTSGSVVGNYVVQNWITFDQLGASSDFTGTVIIIDGTPYSVNQLPKSFPWQVGTNHTFAFQSPLVVAANTKRYVWTSTTGLSTLQSATITVATYGSIVGHYKTQYYLTLATSPPGIASPSGAGWFDANSYATISTVSTVDIVPGSSRYKFSNWTTTDMAEITDPSALITTVLMDKAKTVTANYATQYSVSFGQSGVGSDFTGTVVTVDGVGYARGSLSAQFWWDSSSSHTFAYSSPLVVPANSKQYVWTSTSGLSTFQSGTIVVSGSGSVTGNYKTQYYLTVTSSYGTTGGEGWYDSGNTAYATLDTGLVNHGNETQHVFTNWNGDASGTNYAQSNPIIMNGPKTAIARWKTQYHIIFDQYGLDSSASSTVVTVNGAPKTYGALPYGVWIDNGGSATYAYGNVSSSTAGKRFILTGVSGPASPITVTGPLSVIGNYKTQYQITFSQSGVGPDFTGTIVTVDSTAYTRTGLPFSPWFDSNSVHAFAFSSPLTVNISRQYDWSSTVGLSVLQSDNLTITGSGSVTGNYVVHLKYLVTFSQSGVGPDFPGTIVIIDGNNYGYTGLSVSFWWDSGSSHTFAFQSPLVVATNLKRYVWTSTTGLSTTQNGTITVSGSGTVTGNYKIQYYLTLDTSPPGIDSPSAEGWYDAGTLAAISTDAFVDIVPGSSRYRFNGWTTSDMPEITDPSRSPTTVLMDQGKTVTANYAVQYAVIFAQTGVGSDFGGTVVTVDSSGYTASSLPTAPFWWDKNSIHTFAFQSPLVVTANAKQYNWTSTTGLSTLKSGSITVTTFGSVVGNYRTQYYLTVNSLYDSPNPTGRWYDAGTSITASVTSPASGPTDTRYVCTGWTGTGSVPASGTTTSVTLTINAASSITWNWKTQYFLTVGTIPVGITTIPGQGWYDASASVTLTAPPVLTYTFNHWSVDGVSRGTGVNPIIVTMSAAHTAMAVYEKTQLPLSVKINPTQAEIYLHDSVYFTATVSGGTVPYSYQWYVGGSPVSGANGSTWMFTPGSTGTYFAYVKVTDAHGNTTQSENARVVVTERPQGGYSISLAKPIAVAPLVGYAMIMAVFCVAISLFRRKRK